MNKTCEKCDNKHICKYTELLDNISRYMTDNIKIGGIEVIIKCMYAKEK